MADDVLASFLVALRFDVNRSSQQAAVKSIADYEKAVKEAEKRIEDAKWAAAQTDEEIAKLARETNLKLAREALEGAKAREKTEQEQARKRKENNAAFIAGLEKAAIAAAAAAAAISYAVAKVAGSFDNLYFQAQRSGTSVQSLKALGYGFSQVGGTAQQAGSAVDSFTTKLRNNPGLRQFVKELGVDESLQGVDKFTATMDALVKQPKEIGVQYAEMLGVSEETFNLYLRQGEALKRYRAEYDETAKRFGLDSEQAAAASTAFQRALTRLQATAGVLTDKLMASLAPAIQGLIDRFQKWVDSNPGVLDKILNDIAKAVISAAEAIGKFLSEIAGDNGEAFLKKWDAFIARADRFAKTVERIVYGIERLLKLLHLVSGTNTVLGSGDRTIAALNAISGGTAAPFGPGGTAAPIGAPSGLGSAPAGPDDRTWWQRNMPKALGGKEAPGAGSDGGRAIKPTSKGIDPKVEAYIRKAAAARGINPDTAVGIADGEGLGGSTYEHLTPGDFDKNKNPTSFGPFQMHRGGAGSVGTEYEKATGHKVDDPTHLEEQIDFSLDWAKKHGWGAWYGRSKHDIGVREGLNYDPNAPKGAPKQVGGNVPPVNGVGGLDQNQGGAQYRRQPITDTLQKQIVAAATSAGVNAEVFSGGQDESGPNRTGSHRHDHGNSADLKLYRMEDGKKRYLSMLNDADRAVMEKFIRTSVAAGANGVGAAPDYMGANGIHVGGGSSAAWGAGGSTANAPDWVSRAHRQGMEDRAAGAAAESVRSAGKAVKAAADSIVPPKPESGSATASQAQSSAPTPPSGASDAPKPEAPQRDRPIIVHPNLTPGGFDPNRIDPKDLAKPAAPLGANSVTNNTSSTSKAVHQTFNNTTTIHEARNARETGRVMEGTFNRMHGMALENAQSAVA